MLPAQLVVPDTLPETFRVLDLSGVLLNGILGGLIARRKNYDLVGFVILAILTATGGGILRDVMIQAGPPFALTDPYYLYTACTGALIAWWAPFTSRFARRFLVVADAVVLGTWAATGAAKALDSGLGVMPALLLGCLTAVGGSMVRDAASAGARGARRWRPSGWACRRRPRGWRPQWGGRGPAWWPTGAHGGCPSWGTGNDVARRAGPPPVVRPSAAAGRRTAARRGRAGADCWCRVRFAARR